MTHADRRDFLKLSAFAGSSILLPADALAARTYTRNNKLNVAVIGAGGKGKTDARGVAGENLVALCDVDDRRAAGTYKRYPKAHRYRDYRVMLEKEKLDAVVISTPDHTHAPAAVMAMQLGLHVYCQKPLTHTVEEARVLRDLARKTGVATSMGNQGTAFDGLRRSVELVRSGVLGAVKEVHVWTDRPGGYWTQGLTRDDTIEKIPATMRWDLWLGPAPYRSYHSRYAPFVWRGVLGLRHRRARRHGVPRDEHAVPRPRAGRPVFGRGGVRGWNGRIATAVVASGVPVSGSRDAAAGQVDLVRWWQAAHGRHRSRQAQARGERIDPRGRQGRPLLPRRIRPTRRAPTRRSFRRFGPNPRRRCRGPAASRA